MLAACLVATIVFQMLAFPGNTLIAPIFGHLELPQGFFIRLSKNTEY